MSTHQIHAGGIVSPEQKSFFEFADEVITRTIQDMKEAKIPQGLIVALLHGHTTVETINMMSEAA